MLKINNTRSVAIKLIMALLVLGAVVATWFFIPRTTNQEVVVATRVAFNPDNFVNPLAVTNQYHPLTPGMQWIRSGTTEVGSRKVPHQIITTMTDVVRIIDGVPAVAMLDESTDSGEVIQVGFDYLAIDKEGNVWILGGYTEEYQGGEYVFAEDAFLGESTGAQVGILAPAEVTMATPRWFIGSAGPKEDPSVGEPVEIGVEVTVPFGNFKNVRAVREGGSKAPDNELKYYAPGVGVIWNVPRDKSLHQDYFELTNFTQLSPEGLAEVSKAVLDLEEHARTEAPEVYGNVPPAKRLLADGTIVDRDVSTEMTTLSKEKILLPTTPETATKSANVSVPKPSTTSMPPATIPAVKSTETTAPPASGVSKISESEAKVIALRAVPGEVTNITLETYAGEEAYFVEISTTNGVKTDVIINAETGKIVRTET